MVVRALVVEVQNKEKLGIYTCTNSNAQAI